MPGHLGRMPPETVLRGKPGRRRDVVLVGGIVRVVREVSEVERSACFHDHEITGAPCPRDVAHSDGRGRPSAPGVTTPYDGVVQVRRSG